MSWVLLKYDTRSNWLVGAIFFAILLLYLVMIIAMYDPDNIGAMSDMLELLPPELVNAMGYGAVVTDLTSFIASYYFGFIIVMFPLIYCIILGNKLVARHVDRGSMTHLLSTPHSRAKIAATQAIFMVGGISLLLISIGALGLLIGEAMFPGEMDLILYLSLNLNLLLMMLAIGAICYFCSCLFNDTKYSLSFGGGIPTAFFVINMLANAGAQYNWLQYFTLFSFYDPVKIISGDHSVLINSLVLGLLAIGFMIGGISVFHRKDLPL